MKHVLLLLFSAAIIGSCSEAPPDVLLFITDGSRDLELMITKEVTVMKEILENSDFRVEIASISGEEFITDSVVIKPDLKLSEVNIADYEGFIFPCMAPPWDKMYNLDPEVVSFVKKIAETQAPMAAQTLSVADFARAGVLAGKKYAFTIDPDLSEYPDFKDGIYSGEGVVRDGRIVTSGTCPWKTREYGKPDGTEELTRLFIEAVHEMKP
jgi:putative intracellular protease/amidase